MKMLSLLLLLIGISCSGSKKESSAEAVTSLDSTYNSPEDIIVSDDAYDSDPFIENSIEMQPKGISATTLESESKITKSLSNDIGEYTVQKNDTLMFIAFKIYGDYRMWREVYEFNQSNVTAVEMLKVGTKLKYRLPESEFVWNPSGNPYLIVRGDYLGLISKKVYNDMSKWKLIYNNNRPLIRDPNLIFAGLTIYYPDIAGRSAAAAE